MANKTVPIPEELIQGFKDLISLDTQIYDLKKEHEIKAAQVWTEIEKRFDCRGQALKFNKDNFTFTIFDNADAEAKAMLDKIRAGKATPRNSTPVVMDRKQLGSALPSMLPKKPSIWRRVLNSFKP